MKITSLFSPVSHGSSQIVIENNDDKISKSKSFSSPISSPDIVPPSPVLEKKKTFRSKKNLNHVLANSAEPKDNLNILQKKTLSFTTIKSTTKSPTKTKKDDRDIDSQSLIDTESLASTICDETDFCSDLFFDDWVDCCSVTIK